MKILVISDSHGDLKKMQMIFTIEKPEFVIFAGDYTKDCEELSYIEETARYIIVKGNCDISDYTNPTEIETQINGKKIFVTHGHLYGVKRTYSTLLKKGEEVKADICICGHTHSPFLELVDKMYLINPGAVIDGKYGVIEIVEAKIYCKLKEL